MRKFLISSPKYKGHVTLIYDANGQIEVIDFSETNMDTEQRFLFKNVMPITLNHLQNGGHNLKSCTVVEVEYIVHFDQFWNEYNKKVNRIRAEKEWATLTKTEKLKSIHSIRKYHRYLERTGIGKLDPENYLKNKRFNDEY